MIAHPRRGRPPVPGSGVPHLLRASVSRRDVVHVTWETLDALPALDQERVRKALAPVFAAAKNRLGMRVLHYALQPRMLHLIVAAGDRKSLSRGMQGLGIRVAKAINRAFGRKGTVWDDRYRERVIRRADVAVVLRTVRGWRLPQ